MSNPNSRSLISGVKAREEYKSCLAAGLLPAAPTNTFPTVIQRWGILHARAPTYIGSHSWEESYWIDAWVMALLRLRGVNPTDFFSNAWTTVTENKPQILELKIAYDEAKRDPARKLVILIQYQMILNNVFASLPAASKDILSAVEVAIRSAQKELDEQEIP